MIYASPLRGSWIFLWLSALEITQQSQNEFPLIWQFCLSGVWWTVYSVVSGDYLIAVKSVLFIVAFKKEQYAVLLNFLTLQAQMGGWNSMFFWKLSTWEHLYWIKFYWLAALVHFHSRFICMRIKIKMKFSLKVKGTEISNKNNVVLKIGETKEKHTYLTHTAFWLLFIFRCYFIHKAFQRGRNDVCPHFIDLETEAQRS